MKKPDVHISDDYAVLTTESGSFYFGYEKTLCECGRNDCDIEEHEELERRWCFEGKWKGHQMILAEPNGDSYDDMSEQLLAGIGVMLDHVAKLS